MARKPLKIPQLIKKADRLFSKVVRLSAADSNGMCTCCSCGKRVHWKKAHAGHFAARTYGATRFDRMNVNPQCCFCNTFSAGNPAGYAVFIKNTYGDWAIDEIHATSKRPMQWKREALLTKIDEYIQEIKRLQKEKGLY